MSKRVWPMAGAETTRAGMVDAGIGGTETGRCREGHSRDSRWYREERGRDDRWHLERRGRDGRRRVDQRPVAWPGYAWPLCRGGTREEGGLDGLRVAWTSDGRSRVRRCARWLYLRGLATVRGLAARRGRAALCR